jgi:hypothetical protein
MNEPPAAPASSMVDGDMPMPHQHDDSCDVDGNVVPTTSSLTRPHHSSSQLQLLQLHQQQQPSLPRNVSFVPVHSSPSYTHHSNNTNAASQSSPLSSTPIRPSPSPTSSTSSIGRTLTLTPTPTPHYVGTSPSPTTPLASSSTTRLSMTGSPLRALVPSPLPSPGTPDNIAGRRRSTRVVDKAAAVKAAEEESERRRGNNKSTTNSNKDKDKDSGTTSAAAATSDEESSSSSENDEDKKEEDIPVDTPEDIEAARIYLRRKWQFAAIMQFLLKFRPNFGIAPINAQVTYIHIVYCPVASALLN